MRSSPSSKGKHAESDLKVQEFVKSETRISSGLDRLAARIPTKVKYNGLTGCLNSDSSDMLSTSVFGLYKDIKKFFNATKTAGKFGHNLVPTELVSEASKSSTGGPQIGIGNHLAADDDQNIPRRRNLKNNIDEILGASEGMMKDFLSLGLNDFIGLLRNLFRYLAASNEEPMLGARAKAKAIDMNNSQSNSSPSKRKLPPTIAKFFTDNQNLESEDVNNYEELVQTLEKKEINVRRTAFEQKIQFSVQEQKYKLEIALKNSLIIELKNAIEEAVQHNHNLIAMVKEKEEMLYSLRDIIKKKDQSLLSYQQKDLTLKIMNMKIAEINSCFENVLDKVNKLHEKERVEFKSQMANIGAAVKDSMLRDPNLTGLFLNAAMENERGNNSKLNISKGSFNDIQRNLLAKSLRNLQGFHMID